MNRIIAIATLGFVASFIATANAETIKVADARVDKKTDADGFVVFISKRNGEGLPIGSALMAVGRGEAPDAVEIEAAFGMYFEGRKMNIGKVTEETIDALRTSTEGQPTFTFFARVDDEMYATALQHVQAWEKGEQVTPGPPPSQILETTRIMLLQIQELKIPYVSAFSPDSQTYYEDISTLNRNK